ncbi:MAG: hypothetical protein H6550_14330 [Chitinophagales bacterium]|nr:hypothetical protein [Chitinophagales bacterium]
MFSKRLSKMAGSCAIAALGLMVGVTACKKKNDNNNIIDAEKTGYAEEQLLLEQIYDNADRLVSRAATMGASSLKGGENPLALCAEVIKDTTTDPNLDRMVISFGSADCLGYDGRYRQGRLIVDYNNKLKPNEKGYYYKITFDGYSVDGNKLAGHKEVWNVGTNAAGNIQYDIASVDTIYLKDQSGKLTGASQRTREWFKGSSTPQTSDDVYRFTGFGHFTRPGGEQYYIEIAKPLVDDLSCNWINEGVINIFPEAATQRVLDFGDGQCESEATIDVNGVTRKVVIP